jgi:hypothetical protein
MEFGGGGPRVMVCSGAGILVTSRAAVIDGLFSDENAALEAKTEREFMVLAPESSVTMLA